jgi:hypothetical protein
MEEKIKEPILGSGGFSTTPEKAVGDPGPRGDPGPAGDSAFVYIAYADAANGTGFTTTFNSSKDYIAVLSTATEIVSPAVGDFTGLWKKYKGETGASAVAGELPSGYVEVETPAGTTSATLEDVPGASTTITLDEAVNISVMSSFQLRTQSGAAPSTIGIAVNINGVDEEEIQRYLSGSTDTGIGAIVHRTDSALPAGTYTVKLRFRRVSGSATPGIDRADLLVLALQGAKGIQGDPASVPEAIVAASSKATPVDADSVGYVDSEASNVLKKLTWANIKSVLKTYFDTLYLALAGGTLTGNLTLGENTSIVLDPALSADGKYCGITRTGTAGAALAFGDLCYLDPTDSRWELADANIAAGADGDPRGILGICVQAAAADGDATTMLLYGTVRADAAFPALTVNAPIYVSETAGDVVVTQPTTTDVVIRVVGFGLTADELFFCPSNDYITHT